LLFRCNTSANRRVGTTHEDCFEAMGLGFAYRGRDGNADRLKDLAAGTETGGADCQPKSLFFHSDLLQGLEIAFDLLSFELMAGGFESSVQFLTQGQGKKTAENMPQDCLLPLVGDRPGIEHRFQVAKHLFHLPEFLVLEGYLLGRQIHIGPHHLLLTEKSRTPLLLHWYMACRRRLSVATAG